MIPINRKERIAYLLIVAFVTLKVLLALLLAPNPAGWDESVYAGMGKYIYSKGEVGLWEEIRPIGLPLLLGAVWLILGIGKSGLAFALAAELLAVAFAAGTLLLTFKLGKALYNEAVGLFALLLTAGTTLFFTSSSLLLTEIPGTFFALLGLLLAMHTKTARGGIATGAVAATAALFKFPHFLLLGPLASIAILRLALKLDLELKKKTMLRAAASGIAAYLAILFLFFGFNVLMYGGNGELSPEEAALEPLLLAASHQNNPAESIDGFARNLLFYPAALFNQNLFLAFSLIGILSLLLALHSQRHLQNEQLQLARRATVLLFLLLYLAYFTALPNKQERFLLVFLPAAALLSAAGFYHVLLAAKGTTRSGLLLTAILFFLAGIAASITLQGHLDYLKERQAISQVGAEEERQATYHQLEQAKVKVPILSSEPMIAYYLDRKIIPYYFSTADGQEGIRKAVERFDHYKNRSVIHYRPQDFACIPQDNYCIAALEKIRAEVTSLPATKQPAELPP